MRQKGLQWILALAALVLAACAPAEGHEPPANRGFLLGVHAAETDTAAGYAGKLDRTAALGLDVVRVPVDWAQLEPDEPGTFDPDYLAELKSRVAGARDRGLQVVVLFAQAPEWANGRPDEPGWPPTPEHYPSYARALVRLANELESAGPVLAWEVWNEPNSTDFWPAYEGREREGTFVLVPLEAAREYAGLLAAAYDALKADRPERRVLGGSLASADADYLAALLDAWAGRDLPMDGLALHPYARPDLRDGNHYGYAQYPDQCNEEIDDLSPPWCFERGLEVVRALLRQRDLAGLPLWLTEFGVASADAWGDAGSEAEQARHLEIALEILDRRAGPDDLNVATAIWYRLDDELGEDASSQEDDDLFGLYREDGTLKPAGAKLRERTGR